MDNVFIFGFLEYRRGVYRDSGIEGDEKTRFVQQRAALHLYSVAIASPNEAVCMSVCAVFVDIVSSDDTEHSVFICCRCLGHEMTSDNQKFGE